MEKNNYQENRLELKQIILSRGMAFFGVTRTDKQKHRVKEISPEIVDGLPLTISTGFKLSDKVIDDIQDHPTRIYLHHYRQINYLLDRVALLLTHHIQKKGYNALPIAASQLIDWENQTAHLSHKHIAVEAGLGWIGKNNLLVTPNWGARVRLVSILTDFPLPTDKKMDMDCGDCKKCLQVCPAGAIKERREDFDHLACFQQLKKFRKEHNIGHYICGICVKACEGRTY